MSFGNASLGTHTLGGGSPAGAVPNATEWSTDKPTILFPEAPYLELYEITSADGNVTRVVDFGDVDASATPGQVTFDGDEYTTVRLSRTRFTEAADGSTPEITLGIADHDRSIAGWVYDNDGLVGASVAVHLIAYSDIGTPALAATKNFRVSRAQSTSGPAAVSVTIAAPAPSGFKYPHIKFARARCHNEWHNRFDHNDKNFCPFPSDEFEVATRQTFDTSSAAETEGEHGWHAINATNATWIYTGEVSSSFGTTATTDSPLYATGSNVLNDAIWEDAARTGVFVYKKISGDVVVSMSTKVYPYTGHDDAICGVLIQPVDDLTSWVFFGMQVVSGTPRYLGRRTLSGTSTDYTAAGSFNGFKLTRSTSDPDDWVTAVADQDQTKRERESEFSWVTGIGTMIADLGTGDLNVGILFALDETGASGTLTFAFDAYHARFHAGGTTTCDGSFTACTARKNTSFFNAFMGMPAGIVKW